MFITDQNSCSKIYKSFGKNIHDSQICADNSKQFQKRANRVCIFEVEFYIKKKLYEA